MRRVDSYTAEHSNGDHFAIVEDKNSGSRGRYTVFVWRVGKTAKIIGREIDLPLAKYIVTSYPHRPWAQK